MPLMTSNLSLPLRQDGETAPQSEYQALSENGAIIQPVILLRKSEFCVTGLVLAKYIQDSRSAVNWLWSVSGAGLSTTTTYSIGQHFGRH